MECNGIKEALKANDVIETLNAKVAGSRSEKVCYRIVALFATIAFLFALLNVLLSSRQTITEVEVAALEVMVFPTAYFCLMEGLEQTVDIDIYDRDGCPRDHATFMTINYANHDGQKHECLPFGKSPRNSGTSALAAELEERFNAFSINADSPNGATWNCYTLNENEQKSTTPDVHAEIVFQFQSTLKTADSYNDGLFVFAGILDPKLKSFKDQLKNGLTYFQIPAINSNSQVFFTVDELIEQDWTAIIASTEAGTQVKKLADVGQVEHVHNIFKDDNVQLKFNPSFNSKPSVPITAVNAAQQNRLSFIPLNYVTRIVTKRYKTWDEVWSAIGGAWATAILLVSVFFVQKTVENPKDKNKDKAIPAEEVQCFRLRGVQSKQAAIQELYNMACDGVEAAEANIEQA
jgi:hypothetical protein